MVKEGGDTVRAQGERDADHDLVQAEPHAEERHQHRHHEAGGGAREEAKPERARAEGGGEAGVSAEQHHPLDADVEHTGLLGDLLAEPRQQQRHAGRDRARDQRDQEGVAEQALRHGRSVPGRHLAALAEPLGEREEDQHERHQHQDEVVGEPALREAVSPPMESTAKKKTKPITAMPGSGRGKRVG